MHENFHKASIDFYYTYWNANTLITILFIIIIKLRYVINVLKVTTKGYKSLQVVWMETMKIYTYVVSLFKVDYSVALFKTGWCCNFSACYVIEKYSDITIYYCVREYLWIM